MGSWRIDTSRWPVVVHSVEGTLSDEQVDEYIVQASAVLERGELHLTIFDTTQMGSVSAYTVAKRRRWMKEYRGTVRRWCLGVAYVVSSPFLRFVTLSSMMVSPVPIPYLVCRTLEEALAWSQQRVPAAMRPGRVEVVDGATPG